MVQTTTNWNIHCASPADVWRVRVIIHDLAHCFNPIVSPQYIRKLWLKSGKAKPYKHDSSKAHKWNHWGARVSQRVLPINLEPDAPLPKSTGFLGTSDDPDAAYIRKHRPSTKHPDLLNHCMMLALNMDPEDRVSAGVLWTTVLEMHSHYLMEQFPSQHEQHLSELADDAAC
ncbi:hypothetical protein NX059_011747 [Plenodomus lindquistii]|nr:hypothetical protein NX059_011747 [Plenodomus lindquistii]